MRHVVIFERYVYALQRRVYALQRRVYALAYCAIIYLTWNTYYKCLSINRRANLICKIPHHSLWVCHQPRQLMNGYSCDVRFNIAREA